MNGKSLHRQFLLAIFVLSTVTVINVFDLGFKISRILYIVSLENESHIIKLPKIKIASLKFVDSKTELGIFGLDSDDAWAYLLPYGKGFVYTHGVHTDSPTYAVSMFHQLHCLNQFRELYLIFKKGETSSDPDLDEHLTHCLDYLRQSIICSADTTLERTDFHRNSSGSLVSETDGVGVTHVCKDAGPIRSFVEQSYRAALEVDKSLEGRS